jgi:hypothetical protein
MQHCPLRRPRMAPGARSDPSTNMVARRPTAYNDTSVIVSAAAEVPASETLVNAP